MPLPTGRIFLPGRYTSEDLAQLDVYNKGIEQYNTAYDQYQADINKYNKAIEQWNAGPRTSDFTGVEPTAPTQPGFTQEDIDQFQQEAQGRAASNRNMMMTAIDVARSPEAYNLAGFGFQYGGVVPMQQGIASLQQPVTGFFPQYLPR